MASPVDRSNWNISQDAVWAEMMDVLMNNPLTLEEEAPSSTSNRRKRTRNSNIEERRSVLANNVNNCE